MTVWQKIIVGAIAAVFILILMIAWGWFAYNGKTDVPAFIGELGLLVTVTVGLVSAWFGYHSGAGAALPGVSLINAELQPLASAPTPVPLQASPAPVTVAGVPAQTLQ